MPSPFSGLGLGPRDYFQMLTTGLFICIGGLILARSAFAHGPFQAYLVGALFVAFGVYRVRLIRGQLALRARSRSAGHGDAD